jgi:sarcosine oxidase subunit alpha
MSRQVNRLAQGGAVDRSRSVSFTFDGSRFEGHPGDTLASALLANDVKIVGRSFKYHRPRGVMSAGVEEGGAIVTTGSGARRTANVRATTTELFDGLEAHGQNAWPSVRFDLNAVNSLFGRFFSAGFYYKTFMKPGRGTKAWMFYEKIIRRAAGMGEASREPDPDSYEMAHAHCDLLVVGSGPAGLEAARVAAEAGLQVILAEQDFAIAPGLLSETGSIGDEVSADWRAARIAALEAAGSVEIMPRTTVFGLYDGGVAGMLERVTDHLSDPSHHLPRERFWMVRARRTIVATGALERTVAFGNNDRPGVMLASAAGIYANRFGVAAGRRAIVATNNDSGYQSALDLAAAGVEVAKILDVRERAPDGLVAKAKAAGIEIMTSSVPVEAAARGTIGKLQIGRRSGTTIRAGDWLDCDLVAVSGGWTPVVNLLSHRGMRPVYDETLATFLPGQCAEPIRVAGSAAGVWRAEDCAQSGRAAGAGAARDLGKSAPDEQAPAPGGWSNPIQPLWEVRVEGRKLKSFVDPQHDVKTDDVRLAHLEGYVSVEHLKRYTTLGMATDQGKVGNVIGLALMAEATGKTIADTGTTMFRPPYTPVSLGALAGRGCDEHFRATRYTPMHDWNLAHGAVMIDAGLWKRPWYFPAPGEDLTAAYERETAKVRETVGLCDVTSLGKIAVQGPDAAEFLNRVYINGFGKLPVGRARYGIMLRDDGIVMDDGTTWRLTDTDFFMTTTTANAVKVMGFLEELLETRWPDLRVRVTTVSEQWAGLAVAGPRARQVLEAVVQDVDMSNEAFPFMGVREGRIGGAPCRIARISFSGEMAYEAYVPSDYGAALCEIVWQAAEPLGGVLYGTEALGALRIEKGHVAGPELDGRTTLEDLHLDRMASSKKPFIGNVLRKRPGLMADDRPQLVGIMPKDRTQRLYAGSLLHSPYELSGHGEGWVTSVTFSPELGHWIGLGLIRGGVDAWNGKFAIHADPVRSGNTEVEITATHFVDPDGSRMHA